MHTSESRQTAVYSHALCRFTQARHGRARSHFVLRSTHSKHDRVGLFRFCFGFEKVSPPSAGVLLSSLLTAEGEDMLRW